MRYAYGLFVVSLVFLLFGDALAVSGGGGYGVTYQVNATTESHDLNFTWNVTTQFLSVNGTILVNESVVCTVANGLCNQTGENSTWNEALADTLYYPLSSNPQGYLNVTNPAWTGNTTRITNLETANTTTNARIDSLTNLSLSDITGNVNSTAWTRSGTNVSLSNTGDNVGIGTTNPGQHFHVQGSGVQIGLIESTGATATAWQMKNTAGHFDFRTDGAGDFRITDVINARQPFGIKKGAPANSMFITATGKVGVGTSSPSVNLHVADTTIDGNLFQLQDNDGTCNWNPESGGATPSCSSDERLKKNVRPVNTTDVLSELRALAHSMRTYELRVNNETHTGPIAQLVNQTRPDLISEYTEEVNGTNRTLLMVKGVDTNKLLLGMAELTDWQKNLREKTSDLAHYTALVAEQNQTIHTLNQTLEQVRSAGIAQKQRIDALCDANPGVCS